MLPTAEQADLLGDALLENGALSVSVEDADAGGMSEKPIFGEPGATPQFWDACTLIAHFAPDADADELVRACAEALETPSANGVLFRIRLLDKTAPGA